jgi:hypothetical protein
MKLVQVIALASWTLVASIGAIHAQVRAPGTLTPPPVQPALQPAETPADRVLVVPASATREVAGGRRLGLLRDTPLLLNGGATAGRVNDFVLNAFGGIDYIVVANDGQYMLLPYKAATFDWENRQIGVNMDQARFQQIPTLTQKELTTVFSSQSPYIGQLSAFLGMAPGPAQAGVNVLGNPSGDPLGTASQLPLSGTTIPSGTPPFSAIPGQAPAAGTSAGPVLPSQGSTLRPPQPLTPALPGNPATGGGTTTGSSPVPGTTPSTRSLTPPAPGQNPAAPATPPLGPGTIPAGPGRPGLPTPMSTPTPTPAPAPR